MVKKYKKKLEPRKQFKKYRPKTAKVTLKVGNKPYQFHTAKRLKSEALREQKYMKSRGYNCIIRQKTVRKEGKKTVLYMLYYRNP